MFFYEEAIYILPVWPNCRWASRLDVRLVLWASRDKDFWTQSCLFVHLLSAVPVCFSLLSSRRHRLHPSPNWLLTTLTLSVSVSSIPAVFALPSHFLSVCYNVWLHSTTSTRGRNLLSLGHHVARQPQFSNFLSWMPMTAVCRNTPGRRETTCRRCMLPETTFYCHLELRSFTCMQCDFAREGEWG